MTAESKDNKHAPEARIPKNSEFKYIIAKDYPCWYELSWNKDNMAIVLRLHNDFIQVFQPPAPDSRFITRLSNELKLGEFKNDFDGDIGFDGILKRLEGDGEFSEFALSLPNMRRETEAGKGYHLDATLAYAASASLSAYMPFLELCEEDTSSKTPQLLTIETTTRMGMHGGSFDANVSVALRRWLEQYSGTNTIPEAVSVMMQAYNRMLGLRNFDKPYFDVYIWENGGLNLSCPGNACGLNPLHSGIIGGRGYKLACHNVDNPEQQLTLIAGLAAICDRARAEIKDRPTTSQ